MDERRRFFIKIIALLRHDLRDCFGVSFADGWGFFVDHHLSTEIHRFADWIRYPDGDHELRGHKEYVYCAVITQDGCYLFSGSEDGCMIKWDLRSNMVLTRVEAHTAAVLTLAQSPGIVVSSGTDATIKVWNDEHCALIHTLKGHTSEVSSLTLNKQGTILVSGSKDRTCRVWSMESGMCTRVMKEQHSDHVQSVLFTGDFILSGSLDSSIREWNPNTGYELRNITDVMIGPISDVSLNCDQSMLVCCHCDGITFLKYPTMKVIKSVEISTNHSCFHPLNPTIVAFSDYDHLSIKVYNTDTFQITRILSDQTGDVTCLQFSPDGHRLISVSWDTGIRVWDMSDLK